MKVLITGGAGFIGSNFVHYWAKHHPKDKIRVLDALTYAGNYENLRPIAKKIEFIKGDITNREHLRKALKGVDVVVHYAAESIPESIYIPVSSPVGTRVITFKDLWSQQTINNKIAKTEKGEAIFLRGKQTKVLSFLNGGQWMPIKAITRHRYKDKIVKLSQKWGIVAATPNHSVYSSNLELSNPNKNPELLVVRDINELRKRYKKLNKNLLTILAAYITEGNATFNTANGGYIVEIGQKDRGWLERLGELIKKEFGYKYWISQGRKGNFVFYHLQVSNKKFYEYLIRNCGKYSDGKFIPDWIFDLKPQDREYFWERLLEGDGTKDERYTTTSYKLANQLSLLLALQGKRYTVFERNHINYKQSWEFKTVSSGSHHGLSKKKKEELEYEGWVYDIEVEKTHNFVCGIGNVVCHNTHVDRSVFDPGSFWKANVVGTRILLEEAKKAKVERFHHISTDEVYGELPLDSNERFSESTPYAPRPDNPYAISKAEADRVVKDFYKETGMFITISNCSNNYGPYQFPEKYVPLLITNLIDGYKAPVHGDGQNVRDWIHTDDHAKAVDLILQKGKPGETYLIGAENDRPNVYVAERVVYLYGKDASWIKYVPDRHSNDRRYAIDATKIIEELGWKPEVSRDKFDDGLEDTIGWYKKNEDWWRPLLERRALISNGDNDVFAYMSLDREVGKTKLSFNPEGTVSKKDGAKIALEEKLLTEENKRRFDLIKNKLKTKKWYLKTDPSKRKELMALAKDPRAAGFVEDLANRPEVVGDEKQLKLIKLEYAPKKYPIYGIAAWFEVETTSGEKWAEAIYSWGVGPKSGVRFLVLLGQKGRISHLALLKDNRFPMGDRVYGLAGGFPKLNESVFELILRKLNEDLGIDVKSESTKIGEIVNLGRVMPDAGMTSNHPLIYAVTVDVSEKIFPPIKIGEAYDFEEDVVLWPIEKLSELVNRVDDSYFLAALTRLTLGGISNIKLF